MGLPCVTRIVLPAPLPLASASRQATFQRGAREGLPARIMQTNSERVNLNYHHCEYHLATEICRPGKQAANAFDDMIPAAVDQATRWSRAA